jgi:hypothetical protein
MHRNKVKEDNDMVDIGLTAAVTLLGLAAANIGFKASA